MKKKFYITTPIYYVNASPHIGHSYTTIAADCLSRYMRQILGEKNAWFLTGADEHGQKIQKAADEAGLTSKEFVDKVVVQFQALWKKLNISNNDFIRTTEERHIKTVQKALEIVYKKGDIYEDNYEGWYCTPCETFWIESQLIDGLCPDCKRKVEKLAEKNYFFKLSKYQDWLISYIEDAKNVNFIGPAIRRNEVLSFLKMNKLTDLCISRPRERLKWGIPLPFSPEHVTYVWFDALLNYISAVGYFDHNDKYISAWWEEDVEVVQLVGKDILRQHAIYWPIMLQALGIRQPDTVFAHGWWMLGEDKMSKSRGNVISPLAMADKYGVDVYRYFLLRDVTFGQDGNFSEEAVIKRFNSDLANDLGNLVYRTLTMIEKYYQGNIPQLEVSEIKYDAAGEKIKESILQLPSTMGSRLRKESIDFSAALGGLWDIINRTNKYIEDTKPWNLSKENKTDELKQFIALLVKVIKTVEHHILPFMPNTAELIKEQVGAKQIKKEKPLFPRIDTK